MTEYIDILISILFNIVRLKGNSMLTYSFANLNGESMYTHLYSCIKADITSGVLHAGDKLPSKRMLAKNLGISIITDLGGFDVPVEVSHEEVQIAANAAQPKMTEIMREMIRRS